MNHTFDISRKGAEAQRRRGMIKCGMLNLIAQKILVVDDIFVFHTK
jgi:hypothetical protein